MCTPCNEAARLLREKGVDRGERINTPLCERLRAIEVLNEKHVPVDYLRASKEQRLALLQGLLDADGHVNEQGSVEITLASRALADDVFDLACGLGIKATLNEKPVDGTVYWRVWFTTSLTVFRLPRKRDLLPETVRSTQHRRYITDVRKVKTVPTRCLTVDSESHLFLAGRSYVPTHNTTIAQCYLSGILQARRARQWKNPLTKRAQKRTGHNIYILAPTGVATQRIRNGLALEEDEVLNNGLRRKRTISLRRASSHGIEERMTHLDNGDVYIGTLHSFLGYKGSGFFDIPPPHPSIIYIDEASMIDCEVMYHLARYMLRCIEENVSISVLFSGDHHQLPPVGPGYPFRDLMGNAFGASIPITELTEVKRQEKGSMIAHAADNVKHVRIVPSPRDYASWGIPYDEADFVWHDPAEMPGMQVTDILTNYAAYLTRTRTRPVDVRDIQVILPLRNQSRVEPEAPHTRALNQALQQHYSGGNVFSLPARRSDDSDLFMAHFAVGDKVIHVGENGYTGGPEPINRGSIGFIRSITQKDDDVRVDVAYPWLEDTVRYCEPAQVGQLDLAYAITGHASQGSEYDFVLITLPARAGMNPRTGESMVDRNWLYTTLTRGKKHVMLIAPTFRLQNAVGQSSGQARNTLLALELLRI